MILPLIAIWLSSAGICWHLLNIMNLIKGTPRWMLAITFVMAPFCVLLLAVLWVISSPGDRNLS